MAVGLYFHYPNFTYDEDQVVADADAVIRSHADVFFRALQTETKLVAEDCSNYDRQVSAIYIGGTTPNLDHADKLRRWLDQMSELFIWDDQIEITARVAPERCSRQLLEKLLTLGITRLDFGVGSFDRRSLRLLGRKQTTHQVHEAIYLANALGFGSFGCELVFGLPGQTGKRFSDDLDRITDLDPPHVTLKRWNIDLVPNQNVTTAPPVLEFVDKLHQAAVDHLSELGYEEYAGDWFARPDNKCRYHADCAAGGDYVGLGPSARSLMRGQRSSNVSGVAEYIDALDQGRRPLVEGR